MPTNMLKNLPSVSELLESPQLKSLFSKVNQNVVVSRVRSALDDLRVELRTAAADIQVPNVSELAERIARHILQADQLALRPVINASGTLLHPDLGWSPLAEEAVSEIATVARGYANFEIDLTSGEPAPCTAAVADLLRELTGAEAAVVANSQAGAAVLLLAALAPGREVIVSRGQLADFGAGRRLASFVTASGAVLREVGATNETRLEDYAAAIGEQTAAILLVHVSNFAIVGCTADVTLAELVKLARAHSIPVIHDIGWGPLAELSELNSCGEPAAATSIQQGADVVLAGGDKLLGGPTCGILLGKRKFIEPVARHPLAVALKADKLTLAALAATLRLFRNPAVAQRSIPLVSLLATPLENLKLRAQRLALQMAESPAIKSAEAVEVVAHLGTGLLRRQQIASWGVALEPAEPGLDRLAARLRTGRLAVVGRIEKERLVLDLRGVFPRQDQELLAAVTALADQPVH